jgi:hypothetical protein
MNGDCQLIEQWEWDYINDEDAREFYPNVTGCGDFTPSKSGELFAQWTEPLEYGRGKRKSFIGELREILL